ncbi:MAG: porin [Paracoccaceae bacterium]
MKKVLLATTVLAMTATVAAAEVKVSGSARMGVVYNGDSASDKLQFTSRVRASFTMSGETDSGLSFGASFDAHNAGAANTGNSGSVYVSGAFGKLEMGDVVGAAEAVVGDLPEVGFQDLTGGLILSASDNDTLFLSGDGSVYASVNNPGALYTYSTGGLTFALGFNDGATNAGGVYTGVAGDQAYSIGVKYAVDAYAISLGYEVVDPVLAGPSAKHLIIGGEASFGDTKVNAFYGDGSGAVAGLKHYGLGVSHKIDALTVKGYVKKTELGADSVTAYGLGAAYDLGGGATFEGGLIDNNAPGSKVRADLGVKFKF